MSKLSRQQILDIDDLVTEDVEVPEWNGGTVTIARMTAAARDNWEASVIGKNGGVNTTNFRAKLVVASIVGDDGELQFSDKDIPKLGKKSAKALDRIFSAAQTLNGMGDKDVDELAKNS